ncbi:protein CUSTOS isoform X2 [Sebastes umbrosus]|uniref:protein CUSTOS isoform X2 n=1 Tax=Sebastes umbrosus TaxID=72105 RepID=UPI0018A0FF3B|nr:protein CUSTOS isoform X2 [Sebastes umbrosus]
MAVAAKNACGVSDDSSSSDDEALKRCQEAVWETRGDKMKGEHVFCCVCSERRSEHFCTDGNSHVQQSKRVVVADHEHDGNELQVTQGFRTHVAKKLGHLLDSSITVMQTEALSCVESTRCDDDEGEGFRLFSTSVPGQTADDPPAPVRRRPVPSSSDSDNEMETRLREAAVSVKDLLAASSLLSTLSTPSAELPRSEGIKKKKKAAEEEESRVVKKKKKRKPNPEEGEQVDSVGSSLNAQINGEHGNAEEHIQVKVKRKKKKKRELHTEEEA